MVIRGGAMVDSKLPKILDTTLREGELFQRFRLETRVKVARLLAEAWIESSSPSTILQGLVREMSRRWLMFLEAMMLR